MGTFAHLHVVQNHEMLEQRGVSQAVRQERWQRGLIGLQRQEGAHGVLHSGGQHQQATHRVVERLVLPEMQRLGELVLVVREPRRGVFVPAGEGRRQASCARLLVVNYH